MVRKLLEQYEDWGLKINLEETLYMDYGAGTKYLILEDKGTIGILRGKCI